MIHIYKLSTKITKIIYKLETMKKTLIICSLLLLISSCRNANDNENLTKSENLIGVWQQTKSVIYSGKDNSVLGTYPNDDPCEKNATSEFKSDGKLIISEFYTNSSNVCVARPIVIKNYTFDSTTKKLTVNNKLEGDITKLTNSTLELTADYHYDDNGDGTPDIYIDYYQK
ncbi:hypothetical protein [Frigoriflavimonas asaccharolytica]|uniref:Lipocalin-like protein n=1 Tax=Frigoriflavimonas asaccharolytica TaxID=2735899 RepID=A0A8J8G7N4_9FLAO|nr:hypothetical protein [Frigoriflavimonas asaccharolytica]NRS92998.1 hypothetical protein [Frigoriflavimonas asaccharolytica]